MSEMARPVAIDRIGSGGLQMTVEATPSERDSIAQRLMLPGVSALQCRFDLKRLAGSVIAAQGALAATVTQTCVVTLDEFDAAVAEEFEVRFVPAGTESDDDDPDAPDELPYPAGAIDLGEAAIEQLALALDPYPRKPGLAESETDDESEPSPFAALAALRRPQ